ncbi:hypothetical protein SprV_0200745100 [Sparganum proliferum]
MEAKVRVADVCKVKKKDGLAPEHFVDCSGLSNSRSSPSSEIVAAIEQSRVTRCVGQSSTDGARLEVTAQGSVRRRQCTNRRLPVHLSLTSHCPSEAPLPSSSSSSTGSKSTTVVSAMSINITHHPGTPTDTCTNTSDEDPVHKCLHYDRTFTSHMDLVGHL